MAKGEIGARIREARTLLHPHMRQADLSRAAGIPYQSLQQYEEGISDPRGDEKIARLAAALSVRAEWLKTGAGAMVERNPEDPPKLVDIRLYKPRKIGGDPQQDRVVLEVLHLREWGASKRWSLLMVSAALDPLVKVADVLVFEEREEWESGMVVNAVYQGGDVIGAVRREGDRVLVVPRSGAFPTYEVAEGDVLGVAVMRRRREAQDVLTWTEYENVLRSDIF